MREHSTVTVLTTVFTVFLVLLGLPARAVDCNGNTLEDACDLDCGIPAGPCDLPGCGQSVDCDSNGVPDECDVAANGDGCRFTDTLVDNTTGGADSSFTGPPDDVFFGVGGQIVTWQFGCAFIIDGPGRDFTVYEVDGGSAEFSSIDVLVSEDGLGYVSVKSSEGTAINVPGDELHGSNSFARSYDLKVSGLQAVRFIRIDGNGSGSGGTSTGFDLDALGVVNRIGLDCDGSGILDACETVADCNANAIPDSCEAAESIINDCNQNSSPDECDVVSASLDCDGDLVPDECEPDCNSNSVADDCDVISMTSEDCNSNSVPDECDLATVTFTFDSAELFPIGSGAPQMFVVPSAFPASRDVTLTITATGDFGASSEYIDVDVNGSTVGRVLDSGGQQCLETGQMIVVDADTFNAAVAGGDATISLVAASGVSTAECPESSVQVGVSYDAIVDCNTNSELDYCDIDGGASTDLNVNGIADECEPDCNTNNAPDDYDIAQGTSEDCNANEIPDECDLAVMTSEDCNADQIPDECQTDCNSNGTPDDCDIASSASEDCDLNQVPDECDVAANGAGCPFPATLFENTTGAADAIFTGPPDDVFFGLGGQIVTYEFDCGWIVDGPGPDLTVYEVDSGGAEFSSLDVLVSANGTDFFSVKGTETAAVNIPGDEAHDNNNFARSYELAVSGLKLVRYVRLDGAGTGAAGASAGFDLDAVGAVNRLGLDCDTSGTLDVCEALPDCDGNFVPDSCELVVGVAADCNANLTVDSCDVASMTSADCNVDLVPDECQTDCNANGIPDDCDVVDLTSDDCNLNGVPDECDLAIAAVAEDSGPLMPIGSGFPQSFALLTAFPAASDVTLTFTATGDFGASSEYVDVDLNGTSIGRVFDTGGGQCLETVGQLVVDAGAFNDIVAGGDAVFGMAPPAAVNPGDCAGQSRVSILVSYTPIVDCNTNTALDYCDIDGGLSTDLNINGIADDCEPDCNDNDAPDDYDIEQGTSVDCNDNDVPDECDLDAVTSGDCNGDDIPDECEICDTVEVVFVMDTSTSMTDEGAALCATITQVAADLAADLVSVDTELLAIAGPGSGQFACLTDGVATLYGTTVPGSPPPNNEILGECPGGNEVISEDWGRATSVVAGVKPWLTDSVRLIVPIGDEGPWCGNPVTDPGVDRDSINHAITVAVGDAVIVSPVTGSGSSSSVIAMANLLAAGTGGTVFSSSVPAEDLSAGIQSVILAACDSVSDCNANDVPDECDVLDATSEDCDMNGVPDECEEDCNLNGVNDGCDIAQGASDDQNLNAIPDECETIVLLLDGAEMSWTTVQGALGYDAVQGDLGALRTSAGNFTTSTDACAINDHSGTTLPHGANPAPGDGFWYLVRGSLGTGPLTYDTFGPGQVESRDAEIDAAIAACP